MQAQHWFFNALDIVGGHRMRLQGSPHLQREQNDFCLSFNGLDDGLIVENHPLYGFREFTAEVVFRPQTKGFQEQRFLHIQSLADDQRVLFETRNSGHACWFADTFIKSGTVEMALNDPQALHPFGVWANLTLIYDGKYMIQLVNGQEECRAAIAYAPFERAETAAGMRMNRCYWFKGDLREARFTPKVLRFEELLRP